MDDRVIAWSSSIPLSDEIIVDFSIGTDEQQRAAADRIAARQAESHARWMALPLRVRLYHRARMRWHYAEAYQRLTHAWSALRGDRCDE